MTPDMNGRASDEDKRFDGALNAMLLIDKKDYPCYVGGLKVASGIEHIVKSPVDSSIQFGKFQEAEDGLPDKAAEAAKNVFKIWSKTDRAEIAGIFETLSEMIKKQRYRIAASVTLSCGMTRSDSLYEADRLAEIIDDGTEKLRSGVKGRPVGVFAVISEYNSPLAAPMGYAVSAMLAGNTVVMVPPKECPFPVYMIYDMLVSAGLPDGVLNIVYERRGKAMNALAYSGDISGIVATGRSDRFEELMFAAVDDDIVFINDLKGMNPMIVYHPSAMAFAADMAVRSAFGYSGQGLDSCSKVIITVAEQKQFTDALLVAAKNIAVGDPAEKGTSVGPVISEESMECFLNIVKKAKDHLIYGGRRIVNVSTEAGCYVMPAIFADLPEDHELNEEDHSIPVLSVQTAGDLDEAIAMAADCEFGQSCGIISKDEKAIEKVLKEIGADAVYINGPSGAADIALKADIMNFMK